MRIALTYDLFEEFDVRPDMPWDCNMEWDTLQTITDLATAIESLNHSIERIGGEKSLLENIDYVKDKIDFVFNIAEGYGCRSRESHIPSILEAIKKPYFGSDPYTLSLTLNKYHFKIIMEHFGIPTPEYVLIKNSSEIESMDLPEFPLIVKPCYEGTSIGIDDNSVVHGISDLKRNVEKINNIYSQEALVERLIPGREFTVPIMGNESITILGILELRINGNRVLGEKIFSAKRKKIQPVEKETELIEICPLSETEEDEFKHVKEVAKKVYKVAECRDIGRADFRIDNEGNPYCLEINSLPFLGNSEHSEYLILAKEKGMSYTDIIGMLLEISFKRWKL